MTRHFIFNTAKKSIQFMFVLIRMLTHSTQILCKACFVVKKIDVRLLFGESLNDYKKECFDPQLCGGFI